MKGFLLAVDVKAAKFLAGKPAGMYDMRQVIAAK